jgi:hypothetical protein
MVSPALTDRAAAWSRHEHARQVLGRVLAACHSHGIRALPVKGVLTAHLLYRDPSERRMQDIDLRVTPKDFPLLERLSRTHDFRVLSLSRAYRNIVFDVDGMMVEFEAHIGPRGVCKLPVETLLARAEEQVAPFGFPHLQPELHDHALLLVVNAYKDKIIEAADWAIRDLELIGARGDFDPHRLASLAQEGGVAALTWVVADWLTDSRGHAAWARVRSLLGLAPRPRYRQVMRALLHAAAKDDPAPRASTAPAAPSWLPPKLPLESPLKNPPRMLVRILARAASDSVPQRLWSLGATAIYSLEKQGNAVMGSLSPLLSRPSGDAVVSASDVPPAPPIPVVTVPTGPNPEDSSDPEASSGSS